MQQKHLTTSSVARLINKSEARVRQMADRGDLPIALRTETGVRLFDRDVVERIAAERASQIEARSARR